MWGRRKKEILDLLDHADAAAGITAKQIASRTGMLVSNTHTMLRGLDAAGAVERIPGSHPQRWRLPARLATERILQTASLIPPGHWTTHGDIAVAVFGALDIATTIRTTLEANTAQPYFHRILSSGGRIPRVWSQAEPDHPRAAAHARLLDEGVTFHNGRADPARRIPWDDLIIRANAEPDSH